MIVCKFVKYILNLKILIPGKLFWDNSGEQWLLYSFSVKIKLLIFLCLPENTDQESVRCTICNE